MNKLSDTQINYFMKEALKEAYYAKLIDEVPIGAVIVYDNKIIGRGHNLREHSQDATAHAEMLAINEACAFLNSWRLWDCQLFVTIEPCLMCSGAIINSQISNVYFGARNAKFGATRSLYQTLEDSRLNHQVQVQEGILADETSNIMKSFFKASRLKKKRNKKKNK